MGMTVGIKSSGDRHLDLHFSSSNQDGNGKWGTLHIGISVMHEERQPLQSIACELDHDDIDRLIQELQAAKSILAGEADRMILFNLEAICAQCGYTAARHAWSGACIERLPNQMIRFSKTERFRA
jgi:predicted Zn-ribbon and HTH transcriptional regulator